jgi:hypothetical protein
VITELLPRKALSKSITMAMTGLRKAAWKLKKKILSWQVTKWQQSRGNCLHAHSPQIMSPDRFSLLEEVINRMKP